MGNKVGEDAGRSWSLGRSEFNGIIMKESYLPDVIDQTRIKRVLVIKLRHFGDVLLTSPVFTVLDNQIPGVEIDALVYSETTPMLSDHPALNQRPAASC